jgi:hypothetical protein
MPASGPSFTGHQGSHREDLSDVGVAVITNRTGKLCWGMKPADSPIMVLGGLAGLGGCPLVSSSL